MISATLVTVCLLAGVALLRALSYLRMRITSSAMNSIPGPATGSFWTGHMSNLFDRHGMEFHQSLATSYGPNLATCLATVSESLIRILGDLHPTVNTSHPNNCSTIPRALYTAKILVLVTRSFAANLEISYHWTNARTAA
ncbi:uncharacterized protein B0H18DRAFT_503369 [Fomitopsis serialis]|uniref:uncharacterized protein n=1 Tax=Fomitopsis serialis TaxID=139415 RepID=UPI002008C38F|nr:uncharacterized protein B0H18DRAFT_503369 [Neoantrodia serialis]KAH9922754.1 hypothetical protein B0H18DRAFT_503369 [Neoantrodia serialis]